MMGGSPCAGRAREHEDLNATLREFEGVLTRLGVALNQKGEIYLGTEPAGAAQATKPTFGASHAPSGPMYVAGSSSKRPAAMNRPSPQKADAGSESPRTSFKGIRSILDSTRGWRWIVSSADEEGKAQSFPRDADEAAARAADKVALLHCIRGRVLPYLNFPLSEYAASKDDSMARIVQEVLQHFQPMRKVLHVTVQKQLADAEVASAASAVRRKPAKRKRKSLSADQQPSEAHQNGSAAPSPSAGTPKPSPQPAAEADTYCGSDTADDLPRGVVNDAGSFPPLKRLRRKRDMDADEERARKGAKHANGSGDPRAQHPAHGGMSDAGAAEASDAQHAAKGHSSKREGHPPEAGLNPDFNAHARTNGRQVPTTPSASQLEESMPDFLAEGFNAAWAEAAQSKKDTQPARRKQEPAHVQPAASPADASAATHPPPRQAVPEPMDANQGAAASYAPQASDDIMAAESGHQVNDEPAAGAPRSAPGKAAMCGKAVSRGVLQRPRAAGGREPSSREFIFMWKAGTGASEPRGAQEAPSATAVSSRNDTTDWSSSDAQQSADVVDARADISLGSGPPVMARAASAQAPFATADSQDKPAQPAGCQHTGNAVKQEHAQEPLPSTEAAAQAPFGSPQPPVRSLADDIAEQMQPQRQAASASGQPATGTNAAPSQQAAPGQPGSKAEAGTPAGSQAGPSGAVPGARRAAGTTADPVIISDSDSEDEAPQRGIGVRQQPASANMPRIPGDRVDSSARWGKPWGQQQQRPGSLRSTSGLGFAAANASAGRRVFREEVDRVPGPSLHQPFPRGPSRLQQNAGAAERQMPAPSKPISQAAQAWPPSANAQRPLQQAQAASAAAQAYSAALRQGQSGQAGARPAGQPPVRQRQNSSTRVPPAAQPSLRQRQNGQAGLRTAAQPPPQQPQRTAPKQARSPPAAFVDLDSDSSSGNGEEDATSSDVHGSGPCSARANDAPHPRQGTQPGSGQAQEGVTSPPAGVPLGAHRRPNPITGSIFRPVVHPPKYHRRTSGPQAPAGSRAAPTGIPEGAIAAPAPEPTDAAAAASQAPPGSAEELTPTTLVLERDREALAEADAGEWEARRAVIEKQNEEARREKQRRKAQAEVARRSQARLEDHRRQKAEQEAQQDEREIARLQARAQLEARTRWLKAPEAILRALGVPLEMHAGSHRLDIAKTVRKARLTYHPDRHQGRSLQAQVEAEEIFKMISVMKY